MDLFIFLWLVGSSCAFWLLLDVCRDLALKNAFTFLGSFIIALISSWGLILYYVLKQKGSLEK